LLEQRDCAISVLHISAMDQQFKRAAIGIDHGMALAAHDFLSCIIAARSFAMEAILPTRNGI